MFVKISFFRESPEFSETSEQKKSTLPRYAQEVKNHAEYQYLVKENCILIVSGSVTRPYSIAIPKARPMGIAEKTVYQVAVDFASQAQGFRPSSI